jgi:hypothetical protein
MDDDHIFTRPDKSDLFGYWGRPSAVSMTGGEVLWFGSTNKWLLLAQSPFYQKPLVTWHCYVQLKSCRQCMGFAAVWDIVLNVRLVELKQATSGRQHKGSKSG